MISVEQLKAIDCCAVQVDGEWVTATACGLSMIRRGEAYVGCRIGLVVKPKGWPYPKPKIPTPRRKTYIKSVAVEGS